MGSCSLPRFSCLPLWRTQPALQAAAQQGNHSFWLKSKDVSAFSSGVDPEGVFTLFLQLPLATFILSESTVKVGRTTFPRLSVDAKHPDPAAMLQGNWAIVRPSSFGDAGRSSMSSARVDPGLWNL